MNYLRTLLGLLVVTCLLLSNSGNALADKPRMLVLTDVSSWETDDHESLIRLMAHADMFEIEGLVMTTGYSISTLNKSPEKEFINIIHGVVDAYEKDLPNLMKRSKQTGHSHDDGRQKVGYWPSADYLRKRIVVGSPNRGIKFIGDDNNSAGSELLIKLADEDDDRPLYVGIWGGGNTLAQAIFKVKKERSAEELKTFLNKLRPYAITDQDRSYRGEGHEISSHGWIYEQAGNDLKFIWDEVAWKGHNGLGKSNWDLYAEHIQNHGSMGSQYPKYKYGVEGDTPAFLHVMPNGLNDPEDPSQSSWGGNFINKGDNLWREAKSCGENFKQTYPAAFNNFAARMDWAKDGKGNRNPQLILDGDSGYQVLTRSADPGKSVTLDASQSTDPDGDKLTFKWWVQGDAGSYEGDVKISDSTSSKVTVDVPADSKGKSFHVVCEVRDNGTHNLSSYRRVIFNQSDSHIPVAQASTESESHAHDTGAEEDHSGDSKSSANGNSSYASWLRKYIPAAYAGTKIDDHGHWWQARVGEPELRISWAEIPEESLGEVEGLYPKKALFIAKSEQSNWSQVENVTYIDDVGYYVSAYSVETMGDWNVQGITVVQYGGEEIAAREFSKTAATTWTQETGSKDVSFRQWLFEFLPKQYPDARMIDHTYWMQGHVGDGVVANWTQWTEEDSSFKAMEAHNLVAGKPMFLEQKGAKNKEIADHPKVTYYEGAGYYISGYDPATMSQWDGKGLSVIQFDGEPAELARVIGLGWARQKSFASWLYQYLPVRYPEARMTDYGKWKQAHITDDDVASWEKWTVKDVTLKYIEDHSLAQGKSFFIQKAEKTQWADHEAVKYYPGVGYYCTGYDPATMSDWNVEGLTLIQFDGDSDEIVEAIVKGWKGSATKDSVSSNAKRSRPGQISAGEEAVAGEPYSPFPGKVVVTKVKHFDNMCWKIAAAGGTWYFENGESSGKTGFNSAFDQAGNDWIGNDADRGYNSSSARGGRHEYRGWPNFGNGNFNHPQRSSGSKSWWVDTDGNEVSFANRLEGDHLIMRSANAKYDLEYHFFPTHAAIKVLKADDKYAFLFEGPIGGEQDSSVEKDFYVLKDGKHRECKEGGLGYLNPDFGNKFPSPFFYLEDSDPKDKQVWYAGVKNVGPESAGDEGWRQGSNMVIFSFGRDEDKRAYTGTDAVCVFGFHDKAEHSAISNFIESRLAAPFSSAN